LLAAGATLPTREVTLQQASEPVCDVIRRWDGLSR
jgi:hypothetical protein